MSFIKTEPVEEDMLVYRKSVEMAPNLNPSQGAEQKSGPGFELSLLEVKDEPLEVKDEPLSEGEDFTADPIEIELAHEGNLSSVVKEEAINLTEHG